MQHVKNMNFFKGLFKLLGSFFKEPGLIIIFLLPFSILMYFLGATTPQDLALSSVSIFLLLVALTLASVFIAKIIDIIIKGRDESPIIKKMSHIIETLGLIHWVAIGFLPILFISCFISLIWWVLLLISS